MPAGDIMRATMVGRFDAEPMLFDLGFVSASGAADFAEDASALKDALTSALALDLGAGGFYTPLSSHYTMDAVRIQDLAPGVSAGLEFPIGVAGQNATDDGLPPSCALCVTWRTGLKGKANRGRTYLSGLAEDSQTAGFWVPETQTWAADAFAVPLMAAFGPDGAGTYALSVVHTQAGGVRLTPPTATPIISYSIHNEVRTLRRRGVGVRISRRRTGP